MKKKAVLAFSGGLDTSFAVVYLKKKYGDVITVTVDTGGFSNAELNYIKKRSKELGAKKHYTIDAKQALFKDFISYLIKGNVLRGEVYPLSVAAERIVQASEVIKIAKKEKATAVAHGSTGVGNDQVRFDITIRALAPELELLAPVRDKSLTRKQEIEFLKKHKIETPDIRKDYSINDGMWGTTIGGRETHDSWEMPDVNYKVVPINKAPQKAEEIIIGFEKGVPATLNNKRLSGVELVKKLNEIAAKHGVGRGIHLGDTVIGIKGRILFEAPAPIVLIKAHRELEKLVHTKWQGFWKNILADTYGSMLHEGLYFDPVMRDIEAMMNSNQKCVTGQVRVKLHKGNADVIGCKSPYSLMSSSAKYGEETGAWTGKEAEGFCKLYGLQGIIAKRRKGDAK